MTLHGFYTKPRGSSLSFENKIDSSAFVSLIDEDVKENNNSLLEFPL